MLAISQHSPAQPALGWRRLVGNTLGKERQKPHLPDRLVGCRFLHHPQSPKRKKRFGDRNCNLLSLRCACALHQDPLYGAQRRRQGLLLMGVWFPSVGTAGTAQRLRTRGCTTGKSRERQQDVTVTTTSSRMGSSRRI